MRKLNINKFKKFDLDVKRYMDVIDSSFTLREDFIQSPLKLRTRNWNLSRMIYFSWAERYIKNNHKDVFNALQKSRKGGGLSSPVQYPRLFEIERIIKTFKPKSALEFGCGTSSVMFAKLLGVDNFITLEENKFWADKMLKSCPKGLDINVQIRNNVIEERDEVVCFYDYEKLDYFDLVYVDGPYNAIEKTEIDKYKVPVKDTAYSPLLPNVDVENLWRKSIYPKYIVIDCRRSTVRRLIKQSNNRYSVFLKSDLQNNCNIRPYSPYIYHTIMIRK